MSKLDWESLQYYKTGKSIPYINCLLLYRNIRRKFKLETLTAAFPLFLISLLFSCMVSHPSKLCHRECRGRRLGQTLCLCCGQGPEGMVWHQVLAGSYSKTGPKNCMATATNSSKQRLEKSWEPTWPNSRKELMVGTLCSCSLFSMKILCYFTSIALASQYAGDSYMCNYTHFDRQSNNFHWCDQRNLDRQSRNPFWPDF